MPTARVRWKDRCVYGIVSTFGWWCCRLPKKWAMQLGKGIGILFYHLVKKRRDIALGNLKIAFGSHLTTSKRTEILQGKLYQRR